MENSKNRRWIIIFKKFSRLVVNVFIPGVETSILLGSLGCLHKMVWHTGSGLAARALFKALYFIYTYHNNNSFSQDIQRYIHVYNIYIYCCGHYKMPELQNQQMFRGI